jgi:hypothetical protein
MAVVFTVESESTYENAADYLIENETSENKEDKAFKKFFENTDNKEKDIIKSFVSAIKADIQQSHKLEFDKEAETIDLPEGTDVELKTTKEYRDMACIAGFLTTKKNEVELNISKTNLKFLVLDNNVPVKDKECKVSVKIDEEFEEVEGDFKTDDEGYLEVEIPAGAKEGKIELDIDAEWEDEDPVETAIELIFNDLKKMEIKDIESGDDKNIEAFTQRLAGLGYLQEQATDLDDKIKWAIMKFQDDYGLEITGELKQETVEKMDEVYGW